MIPNNEYSRIQTDHMESRIHWKCGTNEYTYCIRVYMAVYIYHIICGQKGTIDSVCRHAHFMDFLIKEVLQQMYAVGEM